MEKSPKHTLMRLKNVFIVILVLPFAFFLFYSLIGSKTFQGKLQLNILNRYQMTVVSKYGRPISVTERSTVLQLPAVSSSGGNDDESLIKPTYHQKLSAVGSNKNAKPSAPMIHAERSNFTGVLLLTYMRSGSSLTGDILQQPKDVFYLFEPLKMAEHIKRMNGSISFLNGTVMTDGEFDLQVVYLESLLGWFTCNFSRVFMESLLDLEFLAFGNQLKPYASCIHRTGLGDFLDPFKPVLHTATMHQKALLKKCIENLQNVCLRSKYRIVKTIRTKMSLALNVLEKVVESKVVHLVRDPRATIESKSHRKVCPLGLTYCISQHCQRVREDTVLKKNLTSRSPERFHTVLYEDIASRPIETAKSMYNFLGMDFTPIISDYISNITLGKNKSGCSVCQTKWQIGQSAASSTSHVASWKRKLPLKYINRTQQLCNDVIKHYGYEFYVLPNETNSMQMKNASNSRLS